MTNYKMVNGVRMPFTARDEEGRAAFAVQLAESEQAEKVVEAARLARIASAKAKLEVLGLTTDEIRDTFNLK